MAGQLIGAGATASPVAGHTRGLMSVPGATVQVFLIGGWAMSQHVAEFEVLGPWSLATSRRFWEGFNACGADSLAGHHGVGR